MVTFRVESNFGGVTFTRSRLDLGFFLREALQNPRVFRIERISPSKLAHHVRLSSPADVDGELERWLREAYRVGAEVR